MTLDPGGDSTIELDRLSHPKVAAADLDTFARNERERQVIDLLRAFQVPRWPHHLSPGTPPELVKILREAMAKTFKDPGFQQDFKKLMGREEPTPFTGEEGREGGKGTAARRRSDRAL